MKLICPSCGATASIEAWSNDSTAREAVVAVASLPAPLHLSTLRYLALFRPAKSALSWKKVLRLVGEINDLAQVGYVSIQGQIDRNCPPRIWAAAMDDMVERQGAIKRPLKNHNYLRQVAYGLADAEDRQRETGGRNAEAAHLQPGDQRGTQSGPVTIASIDPFAGLKEEWDAKH